MVKGFDEAAVNGRLVTATQSVTVDFGMLNDTIHISGMPTLHITATTRTCQGGQIFATMYADDLRLGHATMDIRYRDGGMDAQTTAPLSTYLMLMEFNPLDTVVPAGSTLRLVLTEDGMDYLQVLARPSVCASPTTRIPCSACR